MDAVGTGSAKLILFGEHAAVHGHPALGIQLPERTTVTIGSPRGSSWDVSATHPGDRAALLRLLDRLESLLPQVSANGRGGVSIESRVARGVGMGSSAALCVALIRAALSREAPGGAEDAARVWTLAHELERVFHGTPSGIDTGLSMREGLNAFYPRAPELPRAQTLACAPLILVIAAAPRSGDTAGLVRGIGERVRAGDAGTRHSLERLGGLARSAIEALELEGEAKPDRTGSDRSMKIGRLADLAMRELRGLGLSSPALDLLLHEGAQAGALGGKVSGAGGGGAFFLVASDRETATGICARVSEAAGSAGISLASPPRWIETCSPP